MEEKSFSLPYIFYWLFLFPISSDNSITNTSIANSIPLEEKMLSCPVSSPGYYLPSFCLITPSPHFLLRSEVEDKPVLCPVSFIVIYCYHSFRVMPLTHPNSSLGHYHSRCRLETPSLLLPLQTIATWNTNLFFILYWLPVIVVPVFYGIIVTASVVE